MFLEFLKQNFFYIIILSCFIFTLLIIFSIFNNQFGDINNTSKKYDVNEVITIETLANMSSPISPMGPPTTSLPIPTIAQSFCNIYKHKPYELEKECNKFSQSSCKKLDCCVYANNKDPYLSKCVAASNGIPIYSQNKDSCHPNPMLTQSYCRHHKNDPSKLQKYCNKFSNDKKKCTTLNCCKFMDTSGCAAVSIYGQLLFP